MKQIVAVVNTGVANVASVLFALDRLSVGSRLTTDPEVLLKSTHVILPGVGTAAASMNRLQALQLVPWIRELKQPILGICLGMQLFFEESDEDPSGVPVQGLGLTAGRVTQMKVSLPVPHMGWNQVRQVLPSHLLKGIPQNSYFYFVHSYMAPLENQAIRAIAEYEVFVPAVFEEQNWFGTQFHPERSGVLGQTVLNNFLNL